MKFRGQGGMNFRQFNFRQFSPLKKTLDGSPHKILPNHHWIWINLSANNLSPNLIRSLTFQRLKSTDAYYRKIEIVNAAWSPEAAGFESKLNNTVIDPRCVSPVPRIGAPSDILLRSRLLPETKGYAVAVRWTSSVQKNHRGAWIQALPEFLDVWPQLLEEPWSRDHGWLNKVKS